MSYEAPRNEQATDQGLVAQQSRAYVPGPDTDTVEVKNRVQVGPIIAGILTAIATLLILTVLGLAVGSSALEPVTSVRS